MNTRKLQKLTDYFSRYQDLSVEIEQINRLAMKAADGGSDIEFSIQAREPIKDAGNTGAERILSGSFFNRFYYGMRPEQEKPTHMTTAFHKESGDDVLTLEILGVILARKHEEQKWLEKKVQEVYLNEKD